MQQVRPGQVIGNAYRVEVLVSASPSEVVARAEDPARSPVLLRWFPPGAPAAELVAAARAAAQLTHPALIRVLDAGVSPDGGAWMAEELVSEASVAALLAGHTRLASVTAVDLVLQACAGVAAAHAAQLVHGDLTLESLRIEQRADGRRQVRVAGAWRAANKVAAPSTKSVAPPERAAGAAIDGRTDVWSLGAILYHLLAGRPPERLAGSALPTPLEALVWDLPEGLASAVARCLEPNPADRHASVAAFAQSLAPLASGDGRAAALDAARALAPPAVPGLDVSMPRRLTIATAVPAPPTEVPVATSERPRPPTSAPPPVPAAALARTTGQHATQIGAAGPVRTTGPQVAQAARPRTASANPAPAPTPFTTQFGAAPAPIAGPKTDPDIQVPVVSQPTLLGAPPLVPPRTTPRSTGAPDAPVRRVPESLPPANTLHLQAQPMSAASAASTLSMPRQDGGRKLVIASVIVLLLGAVVSVIVWRVRTTPPAAAPVAAPAAAPAAPAVAAPAVAAPAPAVAAPAVAAPAPAVAAPTPAPVAPAVAAKPPAPTPAPVVAAAPATKPPRTKREPKPVTDPTPTEPKAPKAPKPSQDLFDTPE